MNMIVVNTGDDVTGEEGFSSLREALIIAQATPGPDTIVFDPSVTTVSLEAPLVIAAGQDITINGDTSGNGRWDVALSGNLQTHHLHIEAGATLSLVDIGLRQASVFGPSGERGEDGAFGANGETGESGESGEAGAPGVMNGSDDWNPDNLPDEWDGGPGGDAGDGAPGADGEDGEDGGRGGDAPVTAGSILNAGTLSMLRVDLGDVYVQGGDGGSGGYAGWGGWGGGGGWGGLGGYGGRGAVDYAYNGFDHNGYSYGYYFGGDGGDGGRGGDGGMGGDGGRGGNGGDGGAGASVGTIVNLGVMRVQDSIFTNVSAYGGYGGYAGWGGYGGNGGYGGYGGYGGAGGFGYNGGNGGDGGDGGAPGDAGDGGDGGARGMHGNASGTILNYGIVEAGSTLAATLGGEYGFFSVRAADEPYLQGGAGRRGGYGESGGVGGVPGIGGYVPEFYGFMTGEPGEPGQYGQDYHGYGAYGAPGEDGAPTAPGTATLSILDMHDSDSQGASLIEAETLFTLYASELEIVEGSGGGTTEVTFFINRLGAQMEATVEWEVEAVSHDLTGDDFVGGVLPSGSVEFFAFDENSIAVTLEILGDDIPELDESFIVRLTGATNEWDYGVPAVSQNVLDFTILDDDPAIGIDDTLMAMDGGPAVTADLLANDIGFGALEVIGVNGDSDLVGEAVSTTLGTLTVQTDGSVDYIADNASFLPEGVQETETFTYEMIDERGQTDTATVTVTVTGVNDPASISGDTGGTVVEVDPAQQQVSGQLLVTDPDAGEDRFQDVAPAALEGSYGSFTFDPETGAWSYALDNDADAVQALPDGAEVSDTLMVTSLDSTASETIEVTVLGTGDRTIPPEPPTVTVSIVSWLTDEPEELPTFRMEVLGGMGTVWDFALFLEPFDMPTELQAFQFELFTAFYQGDSYEYENGWNGEDFEDDDYDYDDYDDHDENGWIENGHDDWNDDWDDHEDGSGDDWDTVDDPDSGMSGSPGEGDDDSGLSGAPGEGDADGGEGGFGEDEGDGPGMDTPSPEMQNNGIIFSFVPGSVDGHPDLTNFVVNETEALFGMIRPGGVALPGVIDFETPLVRFQGDLSRGVDHVDFLIGDLELTTEQLPNNDAMIEGDTTGDVIEDDEDAQVASGTLSVIDPDPGEDRFQPVDPSALQGTYGAFTFDPDTGAWTYTLDNDSDAVQALPEDAQVADSLMVTSLDGTASEMITVTITGVNDPASISGDATGLVVEDVPDSLEAGGTLSVTDIDTGEDRFQPVDPAALQGTYGAFAFDPDTGEWAYDLDNDSEVVQALEYAAVVTDTLTVTSLDGTASETIEVTVVGTGDRTATPDAPEVTVQIVSWLNDAVPEIPPTFRMEVLDGTGPVWNFGLFLEPFADPAELEAFQFDLTRDAFIIPQDWPESEAGRAVLFQFEPDSVVEHPEISEFAFNIVDPSWTMSVGAAALPGVGDFNLPLLTFDAYVRPVVDRLDFLIEDLLIIGPGVAVYDPNTSATIGGDLTGSVIEDDEDAQVASGTAVVADPDPGEDRFQNVDPMSLQGSYGAFNFDAASGAWSYTLDNDADAVQALPEGAEVADTLMVTSLDGTATETITVTVTGANDPATISGSNSGSVVEDDADQQQADGVLTVADIDTGEDRFQPVDPASLEGSYGAFTFDPISGAWGYTLDNDADAVQALPEGAEVADTLMVTSFDGTATETITVTVTGVNDPATISGHATGTVLGETPEVVSAEGTLQVQDIDTGEDRFRPVDPADLQGTHGVFTFDPETGAWTYETDPESDPVAALDEGEEVIDTLVVTSLDGTASETISISVIGLPDPIVILDGLVTDRHGGALEGVSVTFSPDEGEVLSTLSDTGGVFTFDILAGTGGGLDAMYDYSGTPRPTAADALDVLRLAVGIQPGFGPATAFDYIAADMNRDGQVTAADALEVLRAAVGLSSPNPPQWVFVDGDADYSAIGRSSVIYETGIEISALEVDSGAAFVGILLGSMQEHV